MLRLLVIKLKQNQIRFWIKILFEKRILRVLMTYNKQDDAWLM